MTTFDTSIDVDKAPLFKPFEWVSKSDRTDEGRYFMLSNIRDLASGASLALAMVERSELDVDVGDAPLIDSAAAHRLIRMSIAAMNIIEECLDTHFHKMQDRAEEQRKAGKEGTQ